MEYVKRRIAATTSKTEINQLKYFSSEVTSMQQAKLEVKKNKANHMLKHTRPK